MMRNRQTIAVLVLTLGVGGCEWMLSIEEGKLRPESAGVKCTEVTDCGIDEPACRVVISCTEGHCVYQDAPKGTVLPMQRQTAGDCLELVCNGMGKSQLVPLVTDVNDGNPCTIDSCNGSTPVYVKQTQVPCYSGPPGTEHIGICQGGLQQCDAQGNPMGECAGEVLPAELDSSATMDGQDNDCDGQIDEDPSCGDGILQPERGEECDDGGTADGDSCSPTCKDQRALTICAGEGYSCALLSGGIAKCWGTNHYGQLGLGDTYSRGDQPGEMGQALPAIDLGSGRRAVKIACGSYHTCVLLDNQTVKCWGVNSFGQLGLGDMSHRGDAPGEMGDALPAIELGTGSIPSAIAVGDYHTCVLLENGGSKCWGKNIAGQLGLEDTATRGNELGEMGDNLPVVDLGIGQTAKEISVGNHQSCALLLGGMIKCWGYNADGRLGLGDTVTRGDNAGEMGDALAFVPLGMGNSPIAISSFGLHTCARWMDGTAKCWGVNDQGALGLGDTNPRGDIASQMGDTLPWLDLGTGAFIAQIRPGAFHTCALLNDGRIKCWGAGAILGLGDEMARGDEMGEMGDKLPFVDLDATVVELATGYDHTCALLSNGSVKCWGLNDFGQLGLGDTNARGAQPNEMGSMLPTVKLFSDKW